MRSSAGFNGGSGAGRAGDPLWSTPEDSQGNLFGNYELLEEIAHGGMGVVYRARQIGLNRIVALKMILSERLGSEADIKRFLIEAQAAAKLQHPNIVAIHEVGNFRGQHFYSMDYVAGQTLAAMVREHSMPAPRAACYVQKIASAIHYAHQQGVLHRDIKPGNVIIDGNDEPHVTDFGLAKLLHSDTQQTLSGTVMGTPSYMSLEQATGQLDRIDARSDVYSMGAVLYELLTGSPPFRGETTYATLKLLAENDPVPPRQINPKIPADLQTICLKALEKQPAKRYSDGAGLAEDLRRFLANEPIQAQPVGWAGRFWRWCKRKPLLATFALTSVLLLVLIAIGSPVAIYRIDRARQSAEANSQLAQARETAVRQTSYATEMLFAAEEIEAENQGLAVELLNRSRPLSGQTDLRGWEWRFLWAKCQSDELFTVGKHDQEIYRLAFLPDGRLVCGDFGQMVRIWDPKSRKILASEKLGGVSDLEISPDGSTVGVAFWTPQMAFLDATTLARKGAATYSSKVFHLAFSPTEKLFATGGPDHVALWNFSLPEPAVIWSQPMREASGLSFAPDGKSFALATRDNRVWVFDTATRVARHIMPTRGNPAEVVFSPDGSKLAVSHWNGAVAIYDPAKGQERVALTNQSTWVSSVAFSPFAPILATSSADQKIRLFNTTNWAEMAVLQGHLNLVDCVAVSPDGRWLASGSKDRTVRIWNLQTNAPPRVTRNFADVQLGFAVSQRAEFGGVINADGTLSLWDLAGRREERRVPVEPKSVLLAVSPVGQAMLLGNKEGAVWLRQIGNTNVDFEIPGASAYKSTAVFSKDGQQFAIGGREQMLLVGPSDGSRTPRALKHPSDVMTKILFTPDGRQVLTANESGCVRACDVATGELVMSFRAHEHVTAGIALDPMHDRLATSSSDGTVALWDLHTQQKLATYGTSSIGFMDLDFSCDGMRIAAASGEGPVKIWDVASGREVARFKGAERVLSVRFAADDRTFLLSTAKDLSLFRAPTFGEIAAMEAEALR